MFEPCYYSKNMNPQTSWLLENDSWTSHSHLWFPKWWPHPILRKQRKRVTLPMCEDFPRTWSWHGPLSLIPDMDSNGAHTKLWGKHHCSYPYSPMILLYESYLTALWWPAHLCYMRYQWSAPIPMLHAPSQCHCPKLWIESPFQRG